MPKHISRYVFLLLLPFLFLCPGRSTAAKIRWIAPPPYSIVKKSPVTVRGYAAEPLPPGTQATVKQPGKLSLVDQVTPELVEKQLITFSVQLAPGKNSIILDDQILDLYYQQDTSTELVPQVKEAYYPPKLHPPSGTGCTDCHWVFDKELTLNAGVPELCLRCHKVFGQTKNKQPQTGVNHEKSISQFCVGCHDPHYSAGDKNSKIKGNSCTGCHKDFAASNSHSADGRQKCAVCHEPHGSPNPAMLRAPKEKLCTGCHSGLSTVNTASSMHVPLKNESCLECHDPHGNPENASLTAKTGDLCRKCHPNSGLEGHPAMEAQCTDCHSGHSSPLKKLLKPGVVAFCEKCHQKYYASGGGHKISKGLQCFDCHKPHEKAENTKLFQYCGRCHLMSGENFAYTHASLPFESVNQCLVCHNMHSENKTSSPKGILYGTQHYPIKNGGCGVCHKAENGKVALRYEGSRNCIRCHGNTVGMSNEAETEKIHAPIRQDDCIACHSPHLKTNDYMLLGEPDKICEWCHGAITRMGDFRHRALDSEKGCRTCHVPHFSDATPLLKKRQPDLCLECHPGKMPDKNDPLAHGIMKEGRCSACHNPHTSFDKSLIQGSKGEACLSCHPQAIRNKKGEPYSRLHGPVGANDCTACHYMGHKHRVAGDKFLETSPSWRVCLDCHASVTDDHVPNTYKFRLARNPNGCLGCHYPHGSDNSFMVTE